MMIKFEWKWIVGFEDLYKISNKGQVYSVESQRMLATPPNKGGYPHFCLSKDGKQYTKRLHTEIAKAFLEPSFGRHVRHLNGNKTDNRLENLAYGTAKENADDQLQEDYQGASNRLSLKERKLVREYASQGSSMQWLMENFNATRSQISACLENGITLTRRLLILKAIQSGFGVSQTAEYFKVTHGAVSAIVKNNYGGIRELRRLYPQNRSLKSDDIPRILNL